MTPYVVSFSRDEFRDLLGLESDENIESVTVSFSPMMEEWHLTVWPIDAGVTEAPDG